MCYYSEVTLKIPRYVVLSFILQPFLWQETPRMNSIREDKNPQTATWSPCAKSNVSQSSGEESSFGSTSDSDVDDDTNTLTFKTRLGVKPCHYYEICPQCHKHFPDDESCRKLLRHAQTEHPQEARYLVHRIQYLYKVGPYRVKPGYHYKFNWINKEMSKYICQTHLSMQSKPFQVSFSKDSEGDLKHFSINNTFQIFI